MARIITKELAQKIAKKLGAEVVTETSAHDIAYVYEGGRLIASFGIRRGQRKTKGTTMCRKRSTSPHVRHGCSRNVP